MHTIPEILHWRSVINPPALSPGQVHLWRIRIGEKGAPLAGLWPLLSPYESERAWRLHRHRERYVRAHAGMRAILSAYTGINPRSIRLQHAVAGKPSLADTSFGLEFNLTTSGDLALLTLSRDEPIGIDCELVRDCKNVVAIAKRMFVPEVASRIATTALQDRPRQFYLAWTALESEVKADGRGLHHRKTQPGRDKLGIRHCVPERGFIAALARRELPAVADWITLELSAGR